MSETQPTSDLISSEDAALLDRLFGPRLPAGLPTEFYGDICIGVDQADGGPLDPAAIAVLLGRVVCQGLGGYPMGWSAQVMDGRTRLDLYGKSFQQIAAAA